MIIDIHQHGGGSAVLPCVVAKCLAEGMAADMFFQAAVDSSLFNDTESLGAADPVMGSLLTGEDIIVPVKAIQ